MYYQQKTSLSNIGSSSLFPMSKNSPYTEEQRNKHKQLAEFQKEQMHAKQLQQEMERIRQIKQDQKDEEERRLYQQEIYDRHVKEKMDHKEFNRNTYESVDIYIPPPKKEQKQEKEEIVKIERWQLPSQFPNHVEKWIDDSVAREFGDLKVNLDLGNRTLAHDLQNINSTFQSLALQNKLLEEKLNGYDKLAQQAKITEDLRRREVWFNICKTVPQGHKYRNDQGTYDQYNFKNVDYYNKLAYKTNDQIDGELNRIINLDKNYLNNNSCIHFQNNQYCNNKKNNEVETYQKYLYKNNASYIGDDMNNMQYYNNNKEQMDRLAHNKAKKDNLFLHYNYADLQNVDPMDKNNAFYYEKKEKKPQFFDIKMKRYFEGLQDHKVQEKLDEINRKNKDELDDQEQQALRDYEDILNKEKLVDFQKHQNKKTKSVQEIYNIDNFVHELDYYKDRYEN